MRVVAMVSGGKDSCYNMMQCVAEGHEIVALANLHPKDKDELDSYMYQTVGHMGITLLAEAMGLPLYRMVTSGETTQTGKCYTPTDQDEVEDLYNLLKRTKDEMHVNAVAVGAIFSDYQRIRVENVCIRLNLVPLAYLWRRDQTELLQEMIDCHVYSIIIKVASLGLVPDRHLGKSLKEMQPHLIKMKDKYGLNVCGEGGEYETFTLDCPLFKQRICVDDIQTIISSSDPVCPIGYINFTKLRLVPKDKDNANDVIVKRSIDFLSDLNESSYSDLSDPDLSESELEQIEMENRMKESMSKEELVHLSRSNSISAGGFQPSPVRIVTAKDSAEKPIVGGTITDSSKSNNTITNNTTTIINNKSSDSIDGNAAVVSDVHTKFPIVFESQAINNQPNVAINSKGWMWVSGIQGYGPDSRSGMEEAIRQLTDITTAHSYEFNNFCYITMYVRSMAEYAGLNEVYANAFNFTNPPTRVCVECPLPENVQIILEAVAFRSRNVIDSDDTEYKRHTMHVQGISHWAPANIGPYSQSTRVGEITYISGQIALVPGSMTIIDGGIRPQCKLTLRHVCRVAKAMNAHGQLRDVVQGICFVTSPCYITEARRQWERRSTNAIMDYIVVPALPRGAQVEWQVWAHSHNDKFDYEETGCSVGDYTVSSRRRWNYENNCAAIVCYVSTGMSSSSTQLTDLSDDIIERHRAMAQNLTPSNVHEILSYTLNKLLKAKTTPKQSNSPIDEQQQSNGIPTIVNNTLNCVNAMPLSMTNNGQPLPAIHLKIFYQVSAQPPIDIIINTILEFKEQMAKQATIAVTVLPASSLQNFSTFISICGIRHE